MSKRLDENLGIYDYFNVEPRFGTNEKLKELIDTAHKNGLYVFLDGVFGHFTGYEDEIASEGRDHLKGNRVELSEEGKEVLNQKISQLRKGQEITIKYFTDGYYENATGVLDAVDVINKELRINTGFINDTGKELPTIIAFEDILEIGVNMT